MLTLFGLALIAFFLKFSVADKCSYETCPKYKPDMLNVHLVCHTHDDAGWLKTVDQYFWGANQSITKDGVQYILNSVLTELARDPGKKFSYAESSFFWRWWNIQDDITRHQVKKLVSQGQLEFVGGGWVQHDEATSHYAAIIDQMTIGHRFLNETFGKCGIPKVAWQIDPFGHSRESASLFAQMGLDALFFARIHHLDRDKRLKNKAMEMMWHGSDDLGADSDILTSVFYQHYMPPDGFCFDEGCNDEPFMDDSRIEGYNVPGKVKDFIAKVQEQAASYATNHIMLTMGGDFQYMNANRWFTNLDKLIHYVNNLQSNGSKVNVVYSTPTCYAQAIINSEVKLPQKSDDFFPYATDVHSYWTGYFTSRPALKGFIRSTSNLFQICQTLDSIAQLDPLDWGDVDVLHRALGIVQHHDAVTGTAKQHVTNDYAKRLYIGIEECQQVANDAMKYLSPIKSKEVPPYHTLCNSLNETVCNVSQSNNKFLVTIHNGLGKWLRSYVRIPVSDKSYSVYDPEGNKTNSQFIPTRVHHSDETAPYQMIFEIELPPLGYATYYVSRSKNLFHNEIVAKKNLKKAPSVEILNDAENGNTERSPACSDCILKNNILTVEFDRSTGLLKAITEKTTNTTTKINQNFFWYKGMDDSVKGEQPSGAYIFRPNGTKNFVTKKVSTKKFGQPGDYVQEFWQTFDSDWLTQVVRIYEGKPYVEFEWTVGPIPFQDNISREIVSVFQSDVKNNDVFYTDSNGRQMIQRKRNYQPTYSYQDNEPIAGNYYPVNTRITIKDGSKTITVLTDRSQGGSSLRDGQLELMVHRRLLQDDWFGVSEALNETGVDGRGLIVTGKHWLLLSKAHAGARKHRVYGQEMFYQPLLTFAPLEEPFDNYRKKFVTSFAGLSEPLPLQVNFLTVAQWQGTSMILRLEHLFQKNEDHEMSRPVSVNLTNLFSTYDVVTAREATLSASGFYANDKNTDGYLSNFEITLQPMQIRTFRVDIRNKLRRKSNRIRERFSD